MQAFVLKRTGGPGVLKLREIPDPVPGQGEARVALEFTGINYAEILSRKGLYGWAPKRPYVPGMEGAGVIEQVGAGVDPNRVGQKVIVGTQYGCYGAKVVVPEELAIPVLPQLSMAENAAFPVNYMTVWVAVFELGRLKAGEKVLITAAAGGVGTAAVQLCAQAGCDVYGLAGSQAKIELIKSLGAAHAFNYREADCFDRLKQVSGGFDLVLELVGGKVYQQSLKLLNPFGRLVVAGFASLSLKKWNPLSWWRTWRDIPRVRLIDMVNGSTGVMATHLGYLISDRERLATIFNKLSTFVAEKRIHPVVGKIFPFTEIAQAHAFIESRQSVGKVLLQH